ncbi:MAG: TonB family protein [Myxococcota bacterium]
MPIVLAVALAGGFVEWSLPDWASVSENDGLVTSLELKTAPYNQLVARVKAEPDGTVKPFVMQSQGLSVIEADSVIAWISGLRPDPALHGREFFVVGTVQDGVAEGYVLAPPRKRKADFDGGRSALRGWVSGVVGARGLLTEVRGSPPFGERKPRFHPAYMGLPVQLMAVYRTRNDLDEFEIAPKTRVPAVVPEMASSRGSVTLKFCIGKDGHPAEIEVLRAKPTDAFNQPAIDALAQWVYAKKAAGVCPPPVEMEFVAAEGLEQN